MTDFLASPLAGSPVEIVPEASSVVLSLAAIAVAMLTNPRRNTSR